MIWSYTIVGQADQCGSLWVLQYSTFMFNSKATANGNRYGREHGGAPLVRTEKVRTGKCQNKKQEKVRTDFVLTVLVPKQENVRTENVRKEFVLTV